MRPASRVHSLASCNHPFSLVRLECICRNPGDARIATSQSEQITPEGGKSKLRRAAARELPRATRSSEFHSKDLCTIVCLDSPRVLICLVSWFSFCSGSCPLSPQKTRVLEKSADRPLIGSRREKKVYFGVTCDAIGSGRMTAQKPKKPDCGWRAAAAGLKPLPAARP